MHIRICVRVDMDHYCRDATLLKCTYSRKMSSSREETEQQLARIFHPGPAIDPLHEHAGVSAPT